MAIVQTRKPRRRAAGHRFIAGTLSVPVRQFDLAEEARQQRKEDAWLRGTGRSSKTLVKHRDLRIVLISMKANTRMHEHKASARISIQTMAGHVRVHLREQAVDLPAGRLLVLDQCLPHDVEALEDSDILLTLSWPPEEEIAECKTGSRRKVRHERT